MVWGFRFGGELVVIGYEGWGEFVLSSMDLEVSLW